MNKNILLTLQLNDFKKEDEISNFFKENMTFIFSNLLHSKTKWRDYWSSHDERSSEIDCLAFYKPKKGEQGRTILLEYKRDDEKNPVEQLLRYLRILKGVPGNFQAIEKNLINCLGKRNYLEINNQRQRDKFWEETILIVIAPSEKFDKQKPDIIGSIESYRATKGKEEIILVEIRKYLDKESKNEFALLSLVNWHNYRANKERWKKILGMKEESIIIQIPKKEKQSENNQKTPTRIPEHAWESEEKENNESSLEQFLEVKGIDEETKKKIKEIDKSIRRIFGKEKKGKMTHGDAYFVYCDNSNRKQAKGQILGIRKPTKKECKIYLADNQLTKEFRKKPDEKAQLAENLTRIVDIRNEKEYSKLITILNNYLEAIKES
ncbi:hypothetical protein [endosymbiont GvMRE of Glomus versiforme]|uniref:hypothetical protein n=1 Tax=endosymbiont GvMRE of Glomus versiforme TaxID=2039283 RepID=UPI0011C3FE12|nr:hypothetical protein [endosymbiont GvMRE of Glomus versiforme]